MVRKVGYIGDDQVVVNLQGLRWIRKSDSRWSGSPETFELEWAYKGQEKTHSYKSKEERDSMYDKVQKALIEQDLPPRGD